MPRGPAPGWRARKQPVTDDYILAAVNQAGGLGKHDADGHYATLEIRGLADREEALEYQRSLFRCALFLHKRRGIPVSMSAKISRDGSAWKLTYTVHDKTHAQKYHLTAHGTDKSKWAYDPTRRDNSAPAKPKADPWDEGPSKKDLDLIEENQRLRAQLKRKGA